MTSFSDKLDQRNNDLSYVSASTTNEFLQQAEIQKLQKRLQEAKERLENINLARQRASAAMDMEKARHRETLAGLCHETASLHADEQSAINEIELIEKSLAALDIKLIC
ncbi:MAG TPA: hypothetical protein PKA63_02115 [Oligoflexia bacterium]|nr:hypothetical protein [Oligoflexia bacterium]HMP47446.1 hypothetical protein [Oligoflexia bacterium]